MNKQDYPKVISVLLHEPYSDIDGLMRELKADPIMEGFDTQSDDVDKPADVMALEPEEILELHKRCPNAAFEIYILTDSPSLNLERMRHARPELSEDELYDAYLDLHSHYFARAIDVYRRVNTIVDNGHDFITHAYSLIPAMRMVEIDMDKARRHGHDLGSAARNIGVHHNDRSLDMDVIEGAFGDHNFDTSDGRRSVIVETSGYVPALPIPHNVMMCLMDMEHTGAREIIYKAFAAVTLGYNKGGLPSLDLHRMEIQRPRNAAEDKALVNRAREAVKKLTGKDIMD